MKKYAVCALFCICAVFVFALPPQKVILDTDMVECFDDGIAMLVLDNSPAVDLLGVTIVAGNNSMPNGTAAAARQLELTGSTVSVYQGSRTGFRASRLIPDVMTAEQLVSPCYNKGGYLRWSKDPAQFNTLDCDPMAKWEDVYKVKYNTSPVYENVFGPEKPDAAGNRDAVDFLIEQVNKYPGEIVIAAIGPLTNIARAILEDPSFPSKVKEIVYMGGAFYIPGNSSSVAELNWWLDPEAAKIAVRAAWGNVNSESYKLYGNQMISGLEANANTGSMPQDVYDKVLENTWPGIRDLFQKKNGTKAPANIWDVLAIGYIVDPSIVLSWNNDPKPADGKPAAIYGVYIDVNAEMSPDYGRSIAYNTKQGPTGSKKAAIQSFIDEDKFWNQIVFPALVDPVKK